MRVLLLTATLLVQSSTALLVGSPRVLRAQTPTMGIFDTLKAAFMEQEEFDDRTAKAQHILLKGGDEDPRSKI